MAPGALLPDSSSTPAPATSDEHKCVEAAETDVLVVGAGPAGLMLGTNLVRYGIRTIIIDDRVTKTSTGRADGLQPKSIETLKQLRLADPLLQRGVRVYDICFWSDDREAGQSLRRTRRSVHYPADAVDVLDPYILLVHQGMVEETFIDDMETRGTKVSRSMPFRSLQLSSANAIETVAGHDACHIIRSRFVVGTDGAHSAVRRFIPDATPEGSSSDAIWGVLDGVIETDFPDLWSKVVVHSEVHGNVLCIPRERNMTRLYIELKPEGETPVSKSQATEDFVMARAKQIMAPYSLGWHSVEWFGVYIIAQRVARRFMDNSQQVFIAGDASHTHSPKAAQGMNTSMHDTLNLGWKLNLSMRGLAKPELLATYEQERRKIAKDLIEFDYEHANAFHAGDAKALAENFRTNVRFISGVGAEYGPNILNRPLEEGSRGALSPGVIPPPARATRYVDANPVDLQLDIPMLGQFRIYFLCGANLSAALPFLTQVCYHVSDPHSSPLHRLTTAAKASYGTRPRPRSTKDASMQLQRYVAASDLFTYALVTAAAKDSFEIADLPPLIRASRWTVYLDDIPESDARRETCLDKWLGGLMDREVAIVNVRPDGYVGSVGRWDVGESAPASSWLDDYYSAFLQPA